MRVFLAIVVGLLPFLSACPSCLQEPTDAGVDAGVDAGEPPVDGGDDPDGGAPDDGGKNPACDENTEGYGAPCAAQEDDPLCGQMLCCTPDNPFCSEGQVLWCYDLGPNDCGGCDELDTTEGRIGEGCGEYGCGVVECGDGGTATVCTGDHPTNQCGGCETIFTDAGPGDVCSTCLSGEQTCTRDLEDMVCWRGREPDNACGGCGRCITAHAVMDDRFQGGYIRTGTIAIFESIGDDENHLVFDPLIEGPGANGLPWTQLYLSDTEDPTQGAAVLLSPEFAQSSLQMSADPVRSFEWSSTITPSNYTYLVLFDLYLGVTISAGVIVTGPPAGYPIDPPDGGPVFDAGATVDAGDVDGGAIDAGIVDAGFSPDAGVVDAGTTPVVDAGGATDAGGAQDAGTGTDAGG